MKTLLILATLTAAAYAADQTANKTPAAPPQIPDDHQKAYLIGSLARATAERDFAELLSDAAKKARESLRSATQEENALFEVLIKDCGTAMSPRFATPAAAGKLPAKMECVANPPVAAPTPAK